MLISMNSKTRRENIPMKKTGLYLLAPKKIIQSRNANPTFLHSHCLNDWGRNISKEIKKSSNNRSINLSTILMENTQLSICKDDARDTLDKNMKIIPQDKETLHTRNITYNTNLNFESVNLPKIKKIEFANIKETDLLKGVLPSTSIGSKDNMNTTSADMRSHSQPIGLKKYKSTVYRIPNWRISNKNKLAGSVSASGKKRIHQVSFSQIKFQLVKKNIIFTGIQPKHQRFLKNDYLGYINKKSLIQSQGFYNTIHHKSYSTHT